jgi:multidrug efflux pump subunit AcrA (membrane-fusion protein)
MNLALPDLVKDNARWIAMAGAILLAGLVYFLFIASNPADGQQDGSGAGGPPPAIVTLAKIEETALIPDFTAPGDIVADRDSIVASEVAGRIQSTLNIGARVSKGTVIAVIDSRSARLARDQAATEVRRLQADLAYQERLVGRLQQLLKEEAESEASLDEALSSRDQTRARLAAARVALETANFDLSRTRIRSPFAGQLVERKCASRSLQPVRWRKGKRSRSWQMAKGGHRAFARSSKPATRSAGLWKYARPWVHII